MSTHCQHNMPPDICGICNLPVHLYQINDCDCYVAHSLEEAKQAALEDYGGDESLIEEPAELTDEEMNTRLFWDSANRDRADPEHWKCPCGYKHAGASIYNRWTGTRWEHQHADGSYVPMTCLSEMNFVQQLGKYMASGGKVPGLFSTTEF